MTNLRTFIHADGRSVAVNGRPDHEGDYVLADPDGSHAIYVNPEWLIDSGFTEVPNARFVEIDPMAPPASPWDTAPYAPEVSYGELEAFAPSPMPMALAALALVMGAAALGAVAVLAIVVFGGAS